MPLQLLLRRLGARGVALPLCEHIVCDEQRQLQTERLPVRRLRALSQPPTLELSLFDILPHVVVAQQLRVHGRWWGRHRPLCSRLAVRVRVDELQAIQQPLLGQKEWAVVELERGGPVLEQPLGAGQRLQELRHWGFGQFVGVLEVDQQLGTLLRLCGCPSCLLAGLPGPPALPPAVGHGTATVGKGRRIWGALGPPWRLT
mmetsp:Transcript_58595/g.152333  ORF Transcript_58595/g.152333 Transcript_58595/m.152333 type:complete len:201 (+) Transcript_58595:855-1457(+)